MSEWKIYRHDSSPHDDITNPELFPAPPAWRDIKKRDDESTRGATYQASDSEVEMVNAALYLRRPLLITGNPGSGKSSLAYSVAWQLKLGDVLWWPINSRSTLAEGLYSYDAIGRLRDLNIAKLQSQQDDDGDLAGHDDEHIGRYIRLGPLGTALYGAADRPRVLLVDEIDKSDIDLPNDLLHVLEEGTFDIPELQRLSGDNGNRTQRVYRYDSHSDAEMVPIENGRIRVNHFPFVVVTSNGERDLPPAFLRRCLRLDIEDPAGTRLARIISAHISDVGGDGDNAELNELIRRFEKERGEQGALLATDQLLNAVFLITRRQRPTGEEKERIVDTVLRELGRR